MIDDEHDDRKIGSERLFFAANEFFSADRPGEEYVIRHVKIGQIPVSTGRPMFFDFIVGDWYDVQFPPGLKPGTYDVYVVCTVSKRDLPGFEAKLREAAANREEGSPATNYPMDEDFDALYMRFNDLEPDRWEPVEIVDEDGELDRHWLSFDSSWAGLADRATIEAGEVLIDATDEEIENADPGYDPRRPDPYNDEAWGWLETASNGIVPYGKGPQHRAVVLSSHGDESLYPFWGMKGDKVCVLLVCTRSILGKTLTYLRRQPDGTTITIPNPIAAKSPAEPKAAPSVPPSAPPTSQAVSMHPAPTSAHPSPQQPTPRTPPQATQAPQPRTPWWKRLFGG